MREVVDIVGADLLADPAQVEGFRDLIDEGRKPFECVGAAGELATGAASPARRPGLRRAPPSPRRCGTSLPPIRSPSSTCSIPRTWRRPSAVSSTARRRRDGTVAGTARTRSRVPRSRVGRPRGLSALERRAVAVWGSGAEGRGVAARVLHRGGSVTFVDDDPCGPVDVDGTSVACEPVGALVSLGVDVLVRSPGVSRYRPEVAAAAAGGMLVTTVSALWFADFADAAVIGITGSKGKTTTATLTALVLEEAGLRVGLGGNIGRPVTDFYDQPRCDAYVIEVSSYQAADITVSPAVGVLTLLAPDHIDWHGGYDHYVADKLNLFAHRSDLALAVNAASAAALAATEARPGRILYGEAGRIAVDALGRVTWDGRPLSIALPPTLRGRHNAVNMCGALTAAALLTGAAPDDDAVGRALARAPALPSGSARSWSAVGGVRGRRPRLQPRRRRCRTPCVRRPPRLPDRRRS